MPVIHPAGFLKASLQGASQGPPRPLKGFPVVPLGWPPSAHTHLPVLGASGHPPLLTRRGRAATQSDKGEPLPAPSNHGLWVPGGGELGGAVQVAKGTILPSAAKARGCPVLPLEVRRAIQPQLAWPNWAKTKLSHDFYAPDWPSDYQRMGNSCRSIRKPNSKQLACWLSAVPTLRGQAGCAVIQPAWGEASPSLSASPGPQSWAGKPTGGGRKGAAHLHGAAWPAFLREGVMGGLPSSPTPGDLRTALFPKLLSQPLPAKASMGV